MCTCTPDGTTEIALLFGIYRICRTSVHHIYIYIKRCQYRDDDDDDANKPRPLVRRSRGARLSLGVNRAADWVLVLGIDICVCECHMRLLGQTYMLYRLSRHSRLAESQKSDAKGTMRALVKHVRVRDIRTEIAMR